MLTNTKKSCFVKSIAMMMALLMVLAVCLTGCGNKAADEAMNKAEAAETAANEAQTAVDAVYEELKKYLLIENDVDEAAIKVLINEALAGYATTEELGDFVKSAQLTELANKVADLYTKSQVNDLLAGKVDKNTVDTLSAQLADALTKVNSLKNEYEAADADQKKALTEKIEAADKALQAAIDAIEAEMDDMATAENISELNEAIVSLGRDLQSKFTKGAEGSVYELIKSALVDYATKEEIKAATDRLDKIESVIEAILAAFYTKEELENSEIDLWNTSSALITEQIRNAMQLDDWDVTTPEVIEAVITLKSLLEKLYSNSEGKPITGTETNTVRMYVYTKEAAAQINDYLDDILGKDYDIFTGTDLTGLAPYEETAKRLEVALIRCANMNEFNEIYDRIKAAEAVRDFQSEYDDLIDELLGKDNATWNFNDSYRFTDATTKKTYQVLTVAEKDIFHTFNDEYDKLIVKYLLDNTVNGVYSNRFENSRYEANLTGSTMDLASQTYMAVWTNGTVDIVVDVLSADAWLVDPAKMTDAQKADLEMLYGEGTWTFKCYTILTGAHIDLWKKVNPWTGLYTIPVDTNEFKWESEGNVFVTNMVKNADRKMGDVTLATDPADFLDVYKSMFEQLAESQWTINDANIALDTFLEDVLAKYGSIKDGAKDVALCDLTYGNITLDQFVEALTAQMAAPLNNSPAYYIFLTGTASVQEYVTIAEERNTWIESSIADNKALFNEYINFEHPIVANFRLDNAADNEYDIYLALLDKCWELLFGEYQKYAVDMLADMMRDYQSIVSVLVADDVAGNDLGSVADITAVTSITANGDYMNNTVAAAINRGELTLGFIDAFLNGNKSFTGWGVGIGTNQAALRVNKNFSGTNLLAYYTNNGAAMTSATAQVLSDPMATIVAHDWELYTQLMGAVAAKQAEINELTLEEAKAWSTNAQPETAFNELLADAVANLDEVYYRFLMEDYIKTSINNLYVYGTEMANFYTYEAGKTTDALIESMEHFMTGYSATIGTAGEAGKANKHTLFADVAKLNNATVTTFFAGTQWDVDLEGADFMEEYAAKDPSPIATNLRDAVDAEIVKFEADLENMAIEDNFLYFVKVASDNLFYAYQNYAASLSATLNSGLVITLQANYIQFSNEIANIERMARKGEYEFDSYKTQYTRLLGKIFGNTTEENAHADRLLGADYTDKLADVKSTANKIWNTGSNGIYDVVRPIDVVTGAADAYLYVGSYVVIFDGVVNTNTQYKDKATDTAWKNLY